MASLRHWVILANLIVIASCQKSDKLTQDPCGSKVTCRECIQTPTCAWCAKPIDTNSTTDQKRCFQPNNNVICEEEYIVNPDNEYSIQEARELGKGSRHESHWTYEESSSIFTGSSSSSSSSGSSSSAHSDAVQISPQKVNLKLRINEAYRITVKYAQAEDYPVDLYYLMDLSKSMEDDKDKLSSLGGLLADSMRNITSNFRLGFGSFVDKVVMPYVSVVPKKLERPCESCEPPYGFKNHMSLSDDTKSFSEEVSRAAVSGNLDAPEGGFDAIMQAVVCKDQIGWRDKARRLLVFSTDAGFHYAGDGKLGGIVKPNDGYCHLDTTGLYTHSTVQDYPSISQINVKVKENAINLIFAVTKEQISVYDRLREHIEGSFSGTLSNDSSNVVELVKDQYNKITSSVELRHTASNHIRVNFFSSCLNDTSEQATNKCDGLKVGSQINFQAEIEVKECPANKSEWIQEFEIVPVGLKEALKVRIEMLCECPCEQPGNIGYEEHSPLCSQWGTLKCGICECDDSHYGRMCQCGQGSDRTDINDTLACRPHANSTADCSGRGICNCGQCQCDIRANKNEVVTGPFCECDNFSCDRNDGKLCSDHGTCECGQCICDSDWSGPACSCSKSQDTCKPPNGGEICSGHGTCICGACKCDIVDNNQYSGKYCDNCRTCTGRCNELKDCVYCQMYKTAPGRLSDEECMQNCSLFTPEPVDTVIDDESKDERLCAFSDEEDCKYAFVYGYSEKDKVYKLYVRAQRERECPAEVYIFTIVFGVMAAIVLIGLALLVLWKVFTTLQDRREFAKFEKEREMAKWNADENPLYKQATSTFKNPTYAGK